ncbi:acyloxyacyl hydrolase [Sphingomonas glaciei]|uniref:Acyloxyacyl hydrolase n=1 Tax=Sphingomonas glaciei TaxID=2938948 RepID=A0ABY5MXH1_9SPHN|nr:acyloxyacyl hydrolase [Sphingomonas glaciei]UUR07051.1 acyloxyacyl hydrolase [Sphingomonas glaciei]
MKIVLPLAAAALSCPAAASAAELFAGLHAHGVKTPLSLNSDREGGADISIGVRGGRIGGTPLQPYAFGQLNTDGGTNFLAAGLSARFGDRLYVRPGVGVAVHDGSASKVDLPDRLALGSRVLFAPEVAIGVQLNDRVGVEASWVHFSHAQLAGKQNPGIDNLGVRLNVRL